MMESPLIADGEPHLEPRKSSLDRCIELGLCWWVFAFFLSYDFIRPGNARWFGSLSTAVLWLVTFTPLVVLDWQNYVDAKDAIVKPTPPVQPTPTVVSRRINSQVLKSSVLFTSSVQSSSIECDSSSAISNSELYSEASSDQQSPRISVLELQSPRIEALDLQTPRLGWRCQVHRSISDVSDHGRAVSPVRGGLGVLAEKMAARRAKVDAGSQVVQSFEQKETSRAMNIALPSLNLGIRIPKMPKVLHSVDLHAYAGALPKVDAGFDRKSACSDPPPLRRNRSAPYILCTPRPMRGPELFDLFKQETCDAGCQTQTSLLTQTPHGGPEPEVFDLFNHESTDSSTQTDYTANSWMTMSQGTCQCTTGWKMQRQLRDAPKSHLP